MSFEQVSSLVRRFGGPVEEAELWWRGIQAIREPRLEIPLLDDHGNFFRMGLHAYHPLAFDVMNADWDQRWRGSNSWFDRPPIPVGVRESAMREEAIASCALDGVPLDRYAALQLLESGRAPRGRAEHAVVQLHTTLRDRLSWFSPDRLSPERLRELHAYLMEGLVAEPGALRTRSDVADHQCAVPISIPAPAPNELEARLGELCRFASGQSGPDHLPRLVRAILVHFWVAYERPFVEANGRVARALYYAVLADERHPSILDMVPISSGWGRARQAYSQAFHNARMDGNDAGYFVHGQLRVLRGGVRRALNRVDQVRQMGEAVRNALPDFGCNERQIELLSRARARPDLVFTIDTHRGRNGITYETARTDLLRLADAGLLNLSKDGRAFVFRASPALQALGASS